MTFEDALNRICSEATTTKSLNLPPEHEDIMYEHLIYEVFGDEHRRLFFDEILSDICCGRYTRRQFTQKWNGRLNEFASSTDTADLATYFVISVQLRVAQFTTTRRPSKLTLRAIYEPSLKLKDRMIFSYLWTKAHWCHVKGRQWKRPSIRKLRKKFGYRETTIQHSLERLITRGFIAHDLRPNPDHPAIRSKKQRFTVTFAKDADVVRQVIEQRLKAGYSIRPGWAKTALGISKRTYHRLITQSQKRPVPSDGS